MTSMIGHHSQNKKCNYNSFQHCQNLIQTILTIQGAMKSRFMHFCNFVCAFIVSDRITTITLNNLGPPTMTYIWLLSCYHKASHVIAQLFVRFHICDYICTCARYILIQFSYIWHRWSGSVSRRWYMNCFC